MRIYKNYNLMMTRTIKLMKFHTRGKSKVMRAIDEPLPLASQKSKENQEWYLKNGDENNEINESV